MSKLAHSNQTTMDEIEARANDFPDESRDATSWLPIVSAPRDGSHILAYRLPLGIRVTNWTNPPTVVHWFDDPDEPGFYTSINERAPEHPFEPTHWMPLPEPPQR